MLLKAKVIMSSGNDTLGRLMRKGFFYPVAKKKFHSNVAEREKKNKSHVNGIMVPS